VPLFTVDKVRKDVLSRENPFVEQKYRLLFASLLAGDMVEIMGFQGILFASIIKNQQPYVPTHKTFHTEPPEVSGFDT
jgi:hypothetical protein